jgi:hypothetical protein
MVNGGPLMLCYRHLMLDARMIEQWPTDPDHHAAPLTQTALTWRVMAPTPPGGSSTSTVILNPLRTKSRSIMH